MRFLFIWPFLLGLGRLILPNLIRTAVPVIASNVLSRFGTSQGTTGQYMEEGDDEEEFEEEDEEE